MMDPVQAVRKMVSSQGAFILYCTTINMMNGDWSSVQTLLFDNDFSTIANSSLFRGNIFRLRAIYLMKKAFNFKKDGDDVWLEYKLCREAIEADISAMVGFGIYHFHKLRGSEPKRDEDPNSPLCLEGIALSLLHMSYIHIKYLRMGQKRTWDEGKVAPKLDFLHGCEEVLALC